MRKFEFQKFFWYWKLTREKAAKPEHLLFVERPALFLEAFHVLTFSRIWRKLVKMIKSQEKLKVLSICLLKNLRVHKETSFAEGSSEIDERCRRCESGLRSINKIPSYSSVWRRINENSQLLRLGMTKYQQTQLLQPSLDEDSTYFCSANCDRRRRESYKDSFSHGSSVFTGLVIFQPPRVFLQFHRMQWKKLLYPDANDAWLNFQKRNVKRSKSD
jgi:hypothetical protein